VWLGMFKFSDEALETISDYVKEFEETLEKFPIRVDPLYARILLSELEDTLKFYCIKHSERKAAERVEVTNVNYVIKKYGKPRKFLKNVKEHRNRQRIALESLKLIEETLGKSKRPKVLDAGCGWGRYLKRLQTSYIKNIEMIGIDIDSLSLSYGKTLNRQVDFTKSDVQALPFNDQIFDLVLCNAVIHEIKTSLGREQLIQEFSRILKPQGMLYISDAFSKFPILSVASKILQNLTPKIEWHFPKNALEKILLRNSLKIVREEKISLNFREGTVSFVVIAIKG
jgi:ubiquinone/menaquinone biosynthesis C-methylase UbiE